MLNIYWFSTEEGDHWILIVASDEDTAWQHLFRKVDYEDPDDLREQYEIDQVTVLGPNSQGVIASIFPHKVDFFIEEAPLNKLG